MAWQDVRGWYEEQDDYEDPDAEPVELEEFVCRECCRTFAAPWLPEDERFCSMACEHRWCWRRAPPVADPGGAGEIPF